MATINTDSGFSSATGVTSAPGTKPSAGRQAAADITDAGFNSGQVFVGVAESDENSLVEVKRALETANYDLEMRQRRLELSVDSETGIAMMSVRDTKSGQILLQVPSEVSLNLAKRIDQLTGVLIDKAT
jgi:flagellar protein FlaG